MNTHQGRVAIVTGAAAGIGRAISVELARRGADVIAVDVEPADGTVSAVREIGRKALSLRADLSDPESVSAITTDVLGFAGRVDILVNNAGIFPSRSIFDLDFAEWKRLQGNNIDSKFLMVKAVIGPMRGHA